MKVFKPTLQMPVTPIKCWNCDKQKSNEELVSIPVALNIGLTFINFFRFTGPFYPHSTCKQCERQAIVGGVVGLVLLVVAGVYWSFQLVKWVSS